MTWYQPILDQSPLFEGTARAAHAIYHKIYHSAFSEKKPLKLIFVDPDEIEYITMGTSEVDEKYYYRNAKNDAYGRFYLRSAGQTVGGNWDKQKLAFSNYIPHQSFVNHFKNGASWEETEYFHLCLELIDEYDGIRGSNLRTKSELLRWFQTRDDLYNKIKEQGYTKQTKRYTKWDMRRYNEITVNIGRDGTLLYNDGKHRLSIAKILGLDEIPVRVVVHHKMLPDNQ